MVADVPALKSLGKRYGAYGGWQLENLEVLLIVSGLNVNRSAEAKFVNMYVNIKEGDMEGGDGPSKSDRAPAVEALKEKEKEITAITRGYHQLT